MSSSARWDMKNGILGLLMGNKGGESGAQGDVHGQ